MNNLQKATTIERKMLAAHSACKRLVGWDKTIPELVRLLKKRAERDGKTIMESLVEVCQLCDDDAVTIMWLLAAGVEAIQSSHPPTVPEEEVG